jgi:hypothetical protein
MLNQEEKERIKQEEIFKLEIQKSLEKRTNRIKKFFSSSVGIFLLSAVFIPFIVYTYNTWSAYEVKRDSQITLIKKLDFEIEGRLSQFLVSFQYLVDIKNNNDSNYDFKSDSARIVFTELWRELKSNISGKRFIFSTYNEFDNRSTVSLIMELSQLLIATNYDFNHAKEYGIPGREGFKPESVDKESKNIREAGKSIITFEIYQYNSKQIKSAHSIMKDFHTDILLKRWSWLFPYTDCPYWAPFC